MSKLPACMPRLFKVLETANPNIDFHSDAYALRRIAMTLSNWHEMECGTGNDTVTRSIERETDEPDSQPYMRVQYATCNGYSDTRYKIADKENGALKRLAKIMAKYPSLDFYVQGDPRGHSLFILRASDIPPGMSKDCCYSNGVAVYK